MIILYTTEDGKSQIQLRAEQETVWLTQLEMSELFSATKQNLSLHLKNIFEDGELMEDSVVKEFLTTAADGKSYRRIFFAETDGEIQIEGITLWGGPLVRAFKSVAESRFNVCKTR